MNGSRYNVTRTQEHPHPRARGPGSTTHLRRWTPQWRPAGERGGGVTTHQLRVLPYPKHAALRERKVVTPLPAPGGNPHPPRRGLRAVIGLARAVSSIGSESERHLDREEHENRNRCGPDRPQAPHLHPGGGGGSRSASFRDFPQFFRNCFLLVHFECLLVPCPFCRNVCFLPLSPRPTHTHCPPPQPPSQPMGAGDFVPISNDLVHVTRKKIFSR